MFLSSVYACVLQSQLFFTEYYNAYLQPGRQCAGGHFRSAAQLQRLRLCTVVNDSLVLDGIEEAIDPTVFWDIVDIRGSCVSTLSPELHSVISFCRGYIDGEHVQGFFH